MIKKKLFIIFLIFCVSTNYLKGDATVSGTVTDAITGFPISGALIQLIKGNQVSYSTTTASDGTYSIAGVKPSNYTMDVSAAGYQNQTIGIKPANNETTIVDFQLIPNGGQISGTVISAATQLAISGATISIFQGTIFITTTTTDASGQYSVSNLAPGNYNVLATATNFQDQIQGATVQAGITTTVNFELDINPGTISGTVIDASTLLPIQGALVEVFDGNVVSGFAVTDASGNYTIPDLVPTNYTIVASADNYQIQTIGATVVSGAITTVNFSLNANPGSIVGQVTNSQTAVGIPGANISVIQNFTIVATTLTDKNGNYSISDLAPGNYIVNANASNFATATTGAIVTAGNVITVNFVLSPLKGKLSGKVINSSNSNPISGATIQIFNNVILINTVLTDSNGNYEVLNLDPGNYTVVASKNGFQTQTSSANIISNTTTTLNFSLVLIPGNIAGHVIDSTTLNPIANALVAVFSQQTFIKNSLTDSNGNYNIFNLAPGTYFVVVIANGFQSTFSIEIVSAGVTTVANFALNTSPGTISGKITDACTGNPVGNVIILAISESTIEGFSLSDNNGLYNIPNLAPNTYTVTAINRNYLLNTKTATVTANSTTTVNFVIIPIPQAPANIQGSIICNRYLTQIDFIHQLTWPASTSGCIKGYKIFRNGNQIGFVASNNFLKFLDCNFNKKAATYSIKAVNSFNQESNSATIIFN